MPIELTEGHLGESVCAILMEIFRNDLDTFCNGKKFNGRSRVLRYGWDYLDTDKWVRDIPDAIDNLVDGEWDSVTLNEYEKGRTIAPHIDSSRFGDEIVILSFGEPATFVLYRPEQKYILQNGSMLKLSGDDRYKREHSVEPVSGLRYSLVFRRKL